MNEVPCFNRELSWIEFNRRVLDEALDPSNRLLERLKFSTIVSSNFDEFFMVRVATLKAQIQRGVPGNCPTGMSAGEQLKRIEKRVRKVIEQQMENLNNDLLPSLAANGLSYTPPEEATSVQLETAKSWFLGTLFPLLAPARIEEEDRVPFIQGLRLHILFRLQRRGKEESFYALLPLPRNLERIVWLPTGKGKAFCSMEDLIVHFGHYLFPGYQIRESLVFRISRDADLGVDERRDEDFIDAMVQVLDGRKDSQPIRLEAGETSRHLIEFLHRELDLTEQDTYRIQGPLDLKGLFSLTRIHGFDFLKDPEWKPFPTPEINDEESLWRQLRKKDVLLHHPFDAYDPIIRMIREASEDPQVLAIKMTLYRTSGDSPIIESLKRAARNKKQVTVVVELKARFDEEQNILWVRELEKAGVLVIYGIAHLKIHAKMCFIVRKDSDQIRRYAHFGTGNYNERTARLYTDISLLTAREDLTYEASRIFNSISGYSDIPDCRKLTLAPTNLKNRFISLIDREAAKSTPEHPGHIEAKLNSLADIDLIRALYRAGQKGVRIDLNVRGICMIVPGLKGISENIRVVSIIDRYLEHSRIYKFHNDGNPEYFLSSADWMPRNLDRRVELLFPVEGSRQKKELDTILAIFFRDNTKGRILQSDGSDIRPKPGKGETRHRAQEELYKRALKNREKILSPKKKFNVRK